MADFVTAVNYDRKKCYQVVVIYGESDVGLEVVTDVESDVATTVFGVDEPDNLVAAVILKWRHDTQYNDILTNGTQ